MKGDFSRLTFNKKKNYSGTLKQQGRVSLDADWNEHIEIIAHQCLTRTKDIIGICGAPIHNAGFEISYPGNGHIDLLISTGRFYVDGILCELYPVKKISILEIEGKQIKISGLDNYDEHLEINRWIHVFTKNNPQGIIAEITEIEEQDSTLILTLSKNVSSLNDDTSPYLHCLYLYSQQPNYPNASPLEPSSDRTDLVYLDVWNRHITAIEDPEIRETALGGPDTDTRIKTIAQVKVLPRVGGPGCLTAINELHERFAPSGGRLSTKTKDEENPEDPCLLAESGGYTGLENRLYRVEIHSGGNLDESTFKWSRDNGSIAYSISEFIPNPDNPSECFKVQLKQLGRDQVLKIKIGDWLEIIGDNTDLDVDNAGTLARVEDVDEAQRILTLGVDVASHKNESHPKVRRWDTGIDTTTPPTPVSGDFIDLEDGIQISFSGVNFKVGDYWVFDARTNTGQIEQLDNAQPRGIIHHYCPLALINWHRDDLGWQADIHDCRSIFPPITELINLYYVSGDGQEAMPARQLPQPLIAGAANGKWPVAGARVKFEILAGNGNLKDNGNTGNELIIKTDANGLAKCDWILGSVPHSQQVKATLLNDSDDPVHLPIYFNANLSEAAHVFYNPGACPRLSDVSNVQDAIDILCQMEGQGGGCAITVGNGGQYPTLREAFDALEKQKAQVICLCLLPGRHVIEENLDVSNKYSIKIVGCGTGSMIEQNCEKFSLGAKHILLMDFSLEAFHSRGRIVLAGKEVTAERCTFIRKTGAAQTPPLVLIKTMSSSETTEAHWQNNQMISWWIESSPGKAGEFLLPPVSDLFTAPARSRLEKLAVMNPHVNKAAYNTALDEVVKDFKKLTVANRTSWFKKRPVRKINALSAKPKTAVSNFFAALNTPRITPVMMRKSIGAIFEAFNVIHYTESLALTYGVGGWLENNNIDGYLSLQYSGKYTPLNWGWTTPAQQKFIKLFVDNNDYIVVDPVTLNLRGNTFYSVRSNGYTIMQVYQGESRIIDMILNTGEWPYEVPQTGYKFLSVSDNLFRTNGNSFISRSLSMNGNQFDGAVGEIPIPAFVFGYDGALVGNIAPSNNARIEKFLRRISMAGNLLQ